MNVIKILIITNHLQYQDGVCRTVIELVNSLAGISNVAVTLSPLFVFDKRLLNEIDDKVVVKPIFKFYFRGFQRILNIVPKRVMHKVLFGDGYDVEIGYCMKLPIELVSAAAMNCENSKKRYYAWMHGYDEGLTLLNEYSTIGKVVCVSKGNADRLIVESKGMFDVEYAYNIVDEDEIVLKSKETISAQKTKSILFSSVGRLTPEKGYLRLVNVAKRLENDGYNFELWIIGDGPERVNIEREIEKLNVKSIKLMGNQENPHKYTGKSDVFVCSSYSEGYSTACVESVLLGIPVISTDVSGADEIVADSNAGLVVENSEDGIYKGMKTVLDSKELLHKWKEDIRISNTNFSKEARLNKIIEVLDLN